MTVYVREKACKVAILPTAKNEKIQQPQKKIAPIIEISDPMTLITAYELIKSNPGNMTKGSTKETLDGLDLPTIAKISDLLRKGQFKFKPGRRVWIDKPGKSTKRPLGISPPRDKVVQKAMQMVLEKHFEPNFLECSHGFRPGRGTHTALKMVDEKFKGTTWMVRGDIEKCYDRFNHNILLRIVSEVIKCVKTLTLIKRALKAGYIDLGKWISAGDKGTPQGSILSPLLSNVVLHKLDVFMTQS